MKGREKYIRTCIDMIKSQIMDNMNTSDLIWLNGMIESFEEELLSIRSSDSGNI